MAQPRTCPARSGALPPRMKVCRWCWWDIPRYVRERYNAALEADRKGRTTQTQRDLVLAKRALVQAAREVAGGG